MAESEKTTKVTLKVAVSEADGYGGAGKPGDTIEVPQEVAERLIAAGIAEAPGKKEAGAAHEESPAEDGGGGATGRRRGTA